MTQSIILLPQPQLLCWEEPGLRLSGKRLIQLIAPRPLELRSSAIKLQKILASCGLEWELAAGCAAPDEQVGARLVVDLLQVSQPEGYRLEINPKGITIQGHDPAGIYYGVCTLAQLIEQAGLDLPGLRIADWPDFAARGVLLDVSRDKVYRMDTLFGLIDMLASWKINQIQLYFEHTFAYRHHPEVWQTASPFTGQEIMELDLYCRERFISLVPNQNSFGHMKRWLNLLRYTGLAETHEPFMAPWGPMQGPFSLCPVDPGSLALVSGLYDELLPHFSSRMFNVGCDEAVDLGQGRSKAICAERGAGQVYLDYLLEINREVNQRGFSMQYWGDIIIHYPELIPALPPDAIALEWGYEADHPFGAHAQAFAQAGIPFYLCPGTSSWNSIAGRTSNALRNLRSAAENGLTYGAIGYLITDWGDNGHWQPLPVSYLGLAMGAAYSWAYSANKKLDVPRAVSFHAFKDAGGVMGSIAYDLGELYSVVGRRPANSSALFWCLQLPFEELKKFTFSRPGGLIDAMQLIDAAVERLAGVQIAGADGSLIGREYRLVTRMLRHAARRGLWLAGKSTTLGRESKAALRDDLDEIIDEYRSVWLERNRSGGLADSAGRLELIRKDYQ
jgi:hexosaminidase